MRPEQPSVVGVGLLSAPATLPERIDGVDADHELVDLLCADPGWVDAMFREIVAASWADPPRDGPAGQTGRPRRRPPTPHPGVRRRGPGEDQWRPRTQGRQRSPPRVR